MNWVPLGEAMELAYGKSLSAGQRVPGSIPVYGSNGIVGMHDTALVEGQTVIVGRKGSAGAIQLVKGPCFPIDTTYFVRPRKGVDLCMEYAAYALSHINLSRLKTSTGVPGLTREDAYREPFPLPPIEEQRRIVDVLNRAASIEQLRRQASAHLRDFVPALFRKMFGEPLENPMGWPTSALGDLLQLTQYGSSQKADAADDAIPMLRMGNVTYDGYLDCRDLKYVDLPPDEMDKYFLAEGDLLFNRTNSKELVGKTGIWDGRFPAIAASYFIRLRVDAALASPTYLWSFMNSSGMKARLIRMAKGAIGQANINAKELQAIPVPVPPLDKQEAFARLVEAAKIRSQLADSANTLAVGLSRSLLDKMLGADRS